jgi:hypothetical protein
MGRLERFMSAVALVAAAIVGIGSGSIAPAQACGTFAPSARRLPSMAYEQVLIIHDAETDRQHFIREVAFRRADKPFGFVVPTPARAEVAPVNGTLFTLLRLQFPFEPLARGLVGKGTVGGYGRGSGAGFGGVSVLETKKVGSFTAFVLAADDENALADWLKTHGFTTTRESQAWLAHYVRMKFHWVAMRYEPPAGATADAPLSAETIRITFPTPVPYYPYLEPARPVDAPEPEPRLLDLWVVGRTEVTPVAMREHDGRREWIRPARAGEVHRNAEVLLRAVRGGMLDELLPEGELVVQTFQDQKRTRPGIGDILFVPATKTELTAAEKSALAPMLDVLDPAIGAVR